MYFCNRFLVTVFSMLFVLLWGAGCDEQQPAESEAVIDFMQGTWQTVASSNVPMHRHENAYVAVGDKFYLIGGRGDRPVEVYDPATQTWEKKGQAPLEIHHFQAVAFDGKIYVMGAFTGGFPYETPIPNIYTYDPATDMWTQGPEIPEDRRRGAAGLVVHNDKFYLVSGIINGHADGHVTWFDSFDPATDTWEVLPDAPHARDHFQVAIIDNKLYAAAGRRSSYATGQTVDLTVAEVDVYDFSTGTWTTLPATANIPTQRAGTTSIVYDDKLVVMGGESVRRLASDPADGPPSAHAEVEAYDPETGSWIAMPRMVQGRHATQAIVYDDMIYIAAGSKSLGGDEIDSQEVYTP